VKVFDCQSYTLQSEDNASKTVHIPIAFCGEYGLELEDVSKQVGLSPDEVIQKLYSKPYYVYMIGFIAGSAYGGDFDDQLVLPRRSSQSEKGFCLVSIRKKLFQTSFNKPHSAY
jgi:allophanate hydrolase subunit 1